MQIYGPSGVHGTHAVGAPHARRVDAPAVQPTAQPQDRLEISSAADFIDQVHQIPDVRQDRIAALRAQIADGGYETPDKLDAALSRLLDEIA